MEYPFLKTKLTKDEITALELKKKNNKHAQIAQIMGKNLLAVNKIIYRAHLKIRKQERIELV